MLKKEKCFKNEIAQKAGNDREFFSNSYNEGEGQLELHPFVTAYTYFKA